MNAPFSLGDLGDPAATPTVVDVDGITGDVAKSMLQRMVRIRCAEESIADLAASGEAKCPCHLAIGQEGCAVGVAEAMVAGDTAFGAHRSHSHYLALNASLDELFAEVLGKAAGCSGGFGGSMHLQAVDQGLLGTVPIVGATIPMAVGAAWAAKRNGTNGIAVAFFGDGATEEGVFHESCNLAHALSAPVVFVCENNLFSSHLAIGLRQPHDSISRYAPVHGLHVRTVDGNDVMAVRQAMSELAELARKGEPGLLEAVTFRWRGHVGPREDIDVGVGRSLDELERWKARDCIARFRQGAIDAGLLTADECDAIDVDERAAVDQAIERARAADYPAVERMYEVVYNESERA